MLELVRHDEREAGEQQAADTRPAPIGAPAAAVRAADDASIAVASLAVVAQPEHMSPQPFSSAKLEPGDPVV